MEKHSQSFDICIICALYEEAEAVLREFAARCGVSFTKEFSGMDHYVYQHTTIWNKWGEPLTVLVTWLSDSGPTQTGLDLKPFLHEFRPRFVAMTGICAGYRGKVKLGDLVVAQYAYSYEEGKIIREPEGSSRHLLEMKTAAPTSQVIQYARGFDGWKEPVREMKRHKFKRQLKANEEPRCIVAPMASGAAVRGDDPFPWLREEYNRNTIALDMEAATFYRALHSIPHMHALVVKGVCDYADMGKNDTYHDYAARASAVYLLAFLQEYVTEQTIPRRAAPLSSSQAVPSPLWNIPYPRNPFFIGRDELLAQLHQQLHTGQATALSQPQAISGLGGIGKTQVAVEYAFQHHQDYQAILWTLADTRESLVSGYIVIAKLLNLPQKEEQDPAVIVDAVLLWLKTHTHWLLILDNADDLAIVRAFLPAVFNGHILLTTRAQATGRLFHRIEVEVLPQDVGALFLLRRVSLLAPDAPLENADATDVVLVKEICEALGGLPLALDQAGAYIEETRCGLSGYQSLYRTRRAAILKERGDLIDDHPEPVATTWSLSFERVEQKNPAAADLLRFCAFLHPDAIPEELLLAGAKHFGTVLQSLVSDPLSLNKAIAALGAYSLLSRDPTEKTLSIHRLVQAVLKDAMDAATQQDWAQQAVLAVNETFPKAVEFSAWQKCEQCLPQALACVVLIEQGNLIFLEAASLLHRIAFYLDERGRDAESESLYQRTLAIREQLLGSKHPDTLASLNNLALTHSRQGKYAEAEPLLQHALLMKEQQLEPDRISISKGLYNLAELYGYEGKYAEADRLFRRVLDIRERLLGLEDLRVAFPLTGLADISYKQGRYAEAEPLYQRALTIREQQLEPEHPDTAQSLNNLACLYTALQRYEQAEPLFQRALAIRERQLGVEHPATVTSLIDLARLYSQMKRYAEAELLTERVLRIYERTMGLEHPKTRTIRREYRDLLALTMQGKKTEDE